MPFDSDDDDDEVVLDDTVSPPRAAPTKKKPTKPDAGAKSTTTKKPKKPTNDENKENADASTDPLDVFTNIDTARAGSSKRLSIERIYQKKSQLEHILLRPDTYIGSVEFTDPAPMWIYDSTLDKIDQREISFVPGLYKIFDEVLVNAADNKQRDPTMNTIKIDIKRETNEISIWNNGKGIPVVEHKVEKMYVPEMIFGTLLTSSNYDDSERKVTGGRNGYGAKLCNIFSDKFTIETSCKEYKKAFKQSWTNNMQKAGEAKIVPAIGDDFTRVTFVPDLAKFKMTQLDDHIVGLMSRRAYDVAGTTRGVKVFLNGKRLPITGFKSYVEMYTKDRIDDDAKVVFESVNARWEVAVTTSEKGFQQVSFVNSIATTKGGRHVDYVTDQMVTKLIESIKKKTGKSGVSVKPFQVKSHMWVFVNALIENPTFDSQTKETLTLQSKNFGSKCELPEKFIAGVMKCGIHEAVMAWVRFKQQDVLDKKCSGKKTSKLKGIPKLEDANDAGTKNSSQCTLILTEGDSAKTLAVSGLGVVGRDRYGVFPLRGKMLNVREGSHKQIMENAEINALIKILGLQYKRKYETEEDHKSLRYGKVMVMADQDQDGSHIKGLLINFVHHNWPSLIQRNFVEEFITPIVKATKGKEEISFFSIPEYTEWKKKTDNWHTYRIKYYKGLGTSTSKEAKEYFSDMARHRIRFKYAGVDDDNAMDMAFSKKKIEERKDWLTTWMTMRKQRREQGLPDEFLYDKDTKAVTFSEFVNKELVLFSNTDNERSIPSLVDGLKPGQRKVLFTCLKRADKREVKVAQLAGAVGEMSAYHHGEASLMSTIIGLAQDYVGSNNINLLLPVGQFGTRLQGGKDSASPRYIFTMLNPVTRALFPAADDNVLRFLFEENQRIEPEWYCPIIPTVLVNGAEGIGTAWSTKIPNFNPRELVDNIRRMMRDEPPQTMVPWFKNFRGTIERMDATRFVCSGEISVLDETTLEITELPIRTWTSTYKETVLEPMLGTDKSPAVITDFKEYHTDQTVKFVVKMTPEKLREVEMKGLHSFFKLQTVINTTSMVLFDADGCLRKFERVEEILEDFVRVRRRKYHDRKKFLEGMLQAQSLRLSNQARFILEKIKGNIVMENKKKAVIVARLIEMKFDPDPVKKWKEEVKRRELQETGDTQQEEEMMQEHGEGEDEAVPLDARTKDLETKLSNYDYLVGMALIKLSEEEKDKLLRESDAKMQEYHTLQGKTWADLWTEDLDNFLVELEKQEAKERADSELSIKSSLKKQGKEPGGKGGKKQTEQAFAEVRPTAGARRITPIVDAAMKQKYETKDRVKEGGGRKKKKEEEDTASLLDRVLGADEERKKRHIRLSAEGQQGIEKFFGKKATGGGGKAKKTKKDDQWDEESNEEEDEDQQPDFGSDEDEDFVSSTEKNKKKATASRRKKKIIDDEEESTINDDVPPSSPVVDAKKHFDVFDIDDDDEDAKPAKKAKAVKAKPATTRKAPTVKSAPKAKTGKKRVAIGSDDEDEEEMDETPPPKKYKTMKEDNGGGRTARARKPVSYKLDDDSMEEEKDDDGEVESRDSDFFIEDSD